MPISLDPGYAHDPDFKHRPISGRRGMSDVDIGTRMKAALDASVESYAKQYNDKRLRGHTAHSKNVSKAVIRLLDAAEKKAQREGRTMDEVLEEHQEVLEERGDGRSRFLQQPGGYTGADARDPQFDVRAKAAEQDRRRTAQAGPSGIVASAAKRVDDLEATQDELNYMRSADRRAIVDGRRQPAQFQDIYDKHGNLIMSAAEQFQAAAERANARQSGGPSVARRPALLDSMGGDTPNADRLRLMERPAPPRTKGKAMKLMHNPSGGGGYHNPHVL